ncbi:MAG: MoaD/ThiS family protein [Pseudomonadota bacterium]
MDTADRDRGIAPATEPVDVEPTRAGADISVTLKLYASLGVYLPAGSKRNEAKVTAASGTTARALLDAYQVPPEACHLVLVNGVYQAPAQRSEATLSDGDSLAVWPPVAGG